MTTQTIQIEVPGPLLERARVQALGEARELIAFCSKTTSRSWRRPSAGRLTKPTTQPAHQRMKRKSWNYWPSLPLLMLR